MIHIDEIANRIKQIEGIKTDKELATRVGLSPNNYFNRKKRGTLLDVFVKYGITHGLNLNSLLIGQEDAEKEQEEFSCWSDEVKGACLELKEILESGDPVASTAIQSNLKAFVDSVRRRKENQVQQDEIRKLTRRVRHLERLTGDGKSADIEAADDIGSKKKAM